MVRSLYEQLYHPHQIAKQRVVERFDGDALDERWTAASGAAGGAMFDAVDDGFGTTHSGDGSQAWHFNNIHHYEPTGCVFIIISKRTAGTTSDFIQVGLVKSDFFTTTDDRFHISNNGGSTFYQLITEDVSATTTNTSIAVDTIYHKLQGELNSSSGRLWMDGVLEATSTTNLPNAPLQPYIRSNRATTDYNAHFRYYEAYNT